MDTRYLEYILAIDQYKSISKAAQALYISQPTLSLFLSNLENELGLQLFIRSQRELNPTFAGKLYLKAAQEMLFTKENLYRQLHDIRNGTAGNISIGFMTIAGSAMFSSVFPEFKKRYPQIELSITEAKTSVLLEKLQKNSLNLGIIALANTENTIFSCLPIKEEEFCLVLPRHLAEEVGFSNSHTPLSPAALIPLKHCKLILSSEGTVKRVIENSIVSSYDLQPEEICEINNTNTLLNFIKDSNFIAFVPSGFLHDECGYAHFRLSTSPHWLLAAAHSFQHQLSEAENCLISLIQNYYAQHQYY